MDFSLITKIVKTAQDLNRMPLHLLYSVELCRYGSAHFYSLTTVNYQGMPYSCPLWL